MKYHTGRKLFAVRRDRRGNDLRGPAFQISRRSKAKPKVLINVSHEICDWRNKVLIFREPARILGAGRESAITGSKLADTGSS
jgi:hypothetical protein